MRLPKEFTERMRRILGEEYGVFEKSYEQPRKYGLRVNTLKITTEEFERIAPFHLARIPWIENGYYYLEEDAPARHPFYYAGLYYLQEPSAMTPASVLPVNPGERVLDLCAAPGGKATALGAKLEGKGLLVANDISAKRAKALLKNIEVFGIANSFVTNTVPAKLAEHFPCFFDKILVDAPCSGEGMFRKDEDVIRAWYPEKSAECAKVQKEIILQAADMLKPGGELLYSTCTFSVEENEEVIKYLLEMRPEMELTRIPMRKGFSEGLCGMEECVRLWPHKLGGEGHFMALLKKKDESQGFHTYHYDAVNASGRGKGGIGSDKEKRSTKGHLMEGGSEGTRPDKKQAAILEDFFHILAPDINLRELEIRGGQVYTVPDLTRDVMGIPFLRNGLYMGELKKDRFEPSQSLAMAIGKEDYHPIIDLNCDDQRMLRYLKGETIEISAGEAEESSGWHLVCTNGYPVGWGKLVNGMLKNKYHPGWRMNF